MHLVHSPIDETTKALSLPGRTMSFRIRWQHFARTETMLNGITSINQQSHTQRKIALLLKKSELLRRRVIYRGLENHSRSRLLMKRPFFVGDGEREIYFIPRA